MRNMTEKGFLNKAKGKVSATAFLAQHREWLTTGTLAQFTTPILAKLDSGDILATPALGEVKVAVMNHLIASQILAAQKSMQASENRATSKPYTATIYDGMGNVCTRTTDEGEVKELISNFEDFMSAERWSDRRLFDGAPDWNGVVVHNPSQRTSPVNRDESFGRILKRSKGAVCKKTASSGKLSWGMKVKGDHFNFSRG